MKAPLLPARRIGDAVPKTRWLGLFVCLLILWAYTFDYSGHSIRANRPVLKEMPKLHIKVSRHQAERPRLEPNPALEQRLPQLQPSQAILGRAVEGSEELGWGWASRDDMKIGKKEAAIWAERQAEVKEAVQHSWKAYEEYAWGYDELMPLNKSGANSFGGLGATLIDSLDTLHMMGLTAEFKKAREWVVKEFDLAHGGRLSLFETIIRIVGGLIAAFDASGDLLFLQKAQELAQKLQLNFPAGGKADQALLAANDAFLLPDSGEAAKARAKAPATVGLAEFASFMVEWHALAARTGNSTYADVADHVVHMLQQRHPRKAFLPIWFNRFTAKTNAGNTYTLGGMSDSYYEYLLKVWLLKGKQVDMYRDMWERAMDEGLEMLLQVNTEGAYFLGSAQVTKYGLKAVFSPQMEELACYLPGNLALGVAEGAVMGEKAVQYATIAEELTHTCKRMYSLLPVGLAPEKIHFLDEGGFKVEQGDVGNVLRPETVESIYYMWRLTGEQRYRQWGWEIFQAFQEHARGDVGYHSLKDVTKMPPVPGNGMESFWLAETLKYLWLLFGDPETLPFDKWVLSTEAHPILIDAQTL
ncbi:g9026 [Coccomyxa viridis]|uniref:alpha-1,2-Mannosidase n=1 Tax=Coccomyxa viridis TaxID=1274662 RepID=A0ABP1G329_9CHLO